MKGLYVLCSIMHKTVNKQVYLLTILLLLAMISGFLMSKATIIGRVGMSLFYQQYLFLKIWWQGALLVFIIWLLLFGILYYVHRQKNYLTTRVVSLCLIVAGLLGLLFTYFDFRHTLSHHLLGERFHLGVYLIWIGWLSITLFYFLQPKEEVLPVIQVER